MRTASATVTVACLLTVVACGGSTSSSGTSGAATDAGTTGGTGGGATVAEYQELTTRVQSAAAAYDATMGAPGMTLDGCAAAHDAYDAQVRAWISQLVQLSGSMDAFMDAHGGRSYADFSCVANAMLGELDAHRLVACTFPTVSGDQAEANRHAGVMSSYTGHVAERCGQMLGGKYAWGPAAPVCGGTTPAGPTADPLALGQRIFETGIGADGQPIRRTGGWGMMMQSGGCAACHGYDGRGRTTMMFTTPDITYANLTDPSGLLDPDGSRGPTYTDDLIRRAATQGVDAEGSALSTIMPRWQLTDQDWDDLLLFLKALPEGTSGGAGPTTPARGPPIGGPAPRRGR